MLVSSLSARRLISSFHRLDVFYGKYLKKSRKGSFSFSDNTTYCFNFSILFGRAASLRLRRAIRGFASLGAFVRQGVPCLYFAQPSAPLLSLTLKKDEGKERGINKTTLSDAVLWC